MNVVLLIAQIALGLIAAPLLNGVIKRAKAGWQNRRGPGLIQPWYDIRKYLAREDVISEHASWLYRWAPYAYFGAYVVALGLSPTIMARSPLGDAGDVLVLAALFVLARFALALAALDTASNFGGMGTSRELAFASLIEPALVIALFALALPAGSTALEALVGTGGVTLARALACGALFIVAIAETGRIPVDNPDTHLELTMTHEGMLLEYSGRPLGLIIWGTHLKQLIILSLLASFFFPWGIAREGSVAAIALGVVVYLFKLGLLGLVLAAIESAQVKIRIFRVPELLGAASLLGLLAVVSGYLIGG
jgi:formate hydrogenlyase subunit 4